jgi:hypothetical protein
MPPRRVNAACRGAFVVVRAVKQKETAMSTIKPRAIVASLVVGIAAVIGVTSMGVSQVAKPKAPQQAADVPADKAPVDKGAPFAPSERRSTVDTSGRNVHVDAPTTTVDVGKDTGKVRVKAPYTNVKVDPDKGQVRVRAPYVDLNIRW